MTYTARRSALVIEDSESIRTMLRHMLDGAAIRVVEAKDGAEGLRHLRDDSTIGLVFLDLNMPGMNGLEVLKQIRAEPTLEGLPVVLLTGSSADDLATAKDLGATGWLHKPVRGEAVLKIARSFLPVG